MKIRSLTCFFDPAAQPDDALEQAGRFVSAARPVFEAAGYPVQTARLATTPFPLYLAGAPPGDLVRRAQQMESAAAGLGFDYTSLGPALPSALHSYALIPLILANTSTLFCSGQMITAQREISLEAVRQCAAVIHQASVITPDGFGNLRFSALANVPASTPFFPAAFHAGGEPAFALAAEAADLAVAAFSAAGSLAEARQNLAQAMTLHAQALQPRADALAEQYGLRFAGIDFSLAPFPDVHISLGGAIEHLGVERLGLPGSLAAAAFLAEAMDRAHYRRAGFNGLMLPVLEDPILATRAAQGSLTLRDLFLYSAVCGAGLDTVPLPGDASSADLAAVLLDLAALALRLDKPLTARLMPIPGKRAGDPTDFSFAYFANSRVMALETGGLHGLLAGSDTFDLQPRPNAGFLPAQGEQAGR
jgi:hypothetical protein